MIGRLPGGCRTAKRGGFRVATMTFRPSAPGNLVDREPKGAYDGLSEEVKSGLQEGG